MEVLEAKTKLEGPPRTVRWDPSSRFPSDLPEFSLYVAIKLYVYRHLRDRNVRAPRTSLELPPFNARRLHRLLAQRGVTRPGAFADFYDVSPYFIRQRLQQLNHGTVLSLVGRGLRGAANYRWNERLSDAALNSFRELQRILGEDLHFALDLLRTYDAFGSAAFGIHQFVEVFRRFRERSVVRRWYRISTGTSAKSPIFTGLVLSRLRKLIALGLVERAPSGYLLSPRGEQAAIWVELFAYSAEYRLERGA